VRDEIVVRLESSSTPKGMQATRRVAPPMHMGERQAVTSARSFVVNPALEGLA
jgi:hypothetical protein